MTMYCNTCESERNTPESAALGACKCGSTIWRSWKQAPFVFWTDSGKQQTWGNHNG